MKNQELFDKIDKFNRAGEMKKFKIEFTYVIKEHYEIEVEAETEDEAKEIFDTNPHDFCFNTDPLESHGLEVEINSIEQVFEIEISK